MRGYAKRIEKQASCAKLPFRIGVVISHRQLKGEIEATICQRSRTQAGKKMNEEMNAPQRIVAIIYGAYTPKTPSFL